MYSVYDPEPLPVPIQCDPAAVEEAAVETGALPRRGIAGRGRPPAQPQRGRSCSSVIIAGTAQFQPPQMAADKVAITPDLPEGAQAFEISPGDVKVLPPERVAGGTQITIEEFDTTSLILCTGDLGMYERIRSMVDSVSHKVVPLAIEQAEIMLRAVTEINGRLAADGHEFRIQGRSQAPPPGRNRGPPPDVPDLLAESQESIKKAREGVGTARLRRRLGGRPPRMRPLRLVMYGHWQQAMSAWPGPPTQSIPSARRRTRTRRRDTEDKEEEREAEDTPKSGLARPPGRLPAGHLLLHAAGTLHLDRLDQGEAGLSLRPQSRAFRKFRRSGNPSPRRAGST